MSKKEAYNIPEQTPREIAREEEQLGVGRGGGSYGKRIMPPESVDEEERLKGGPYGGPYPKKFITPENIPQDSRDEVLDWLGTEEGEKNLKKYLAALNEERIRSLDDGDIKDLIEFVEFCELETETKENEERQKDNPMIQNIRKLREEFERREQIKELAKKTPPPGNLPTVKDEGANPPTYSTGWSGEIKEASRKSAHRGKQK